MKYKEECIYLILTSQISKANSKRKNSTHYIIYSGTSKYMKCIVNQTYHESLLHFRRNLILFNRCQNLKTIRKISEKLLYNYTRGLVHEFIYGWGPPGPPWLASIGAGLAVGRGCGRLDGCSLWHRDRSFLSLGYIYIFLNGDIKAIIVMTWWLHLLENSKRNLSSQFIMKHFLCHKLNP